MATRRTWLKRLVTSGSLLAGAHAASSQSTDPAAGYPKQPIRILCGLSAGATPDLVARLVAAKLGERLGQPVIVETKAGAGGIIAAEYVARAAPDGYTILLAPGSTLSINPAVYAKLPYDARKSFDPIGNVSTYSFILSVRAEHPAKDVKELVAWSRANAQTSNYGSSTAIFQLTTELFKSKTGASLEHIPFRGGGEIVTAILSGQVTTAFADIGPVLPQIKAGKLRALATSGPSRAAELPDVPTLAETGVPGVVVEGYTALVAPHGTPPAILRKLEAELIAIVQLPDVRERLAQLGLIPSGENASVFAARVEREVAMWTTVAKAANIKLD